MTDALTVNEEEIDEEFANYRNDVEHIRTGVWDSVARFQNATVLELQGLIPHGFTGPVHSKEELFKLWAMTGDY